MALSSLTGLVTFIIPVKFWNMFSTLKVKSLPSRQPLPVPPAPADHPHWLSLPGCPGVFGFTDDAFGYSGCSFSIESHSQVALCNYTLSFSM